MQAPLDLSSLNSTVTQSGPEDLSAFKPGSIPSVEAGFSVVFDRLAEQTVQAEGFEATIEVRVPAADPSSELTSFEASNDGLLIGSAAQTKDLINVDIDLSAKGSQLSSLENKQREHLRNVVGLADEAIVGGSPNKDTDKLTVAEQKESKNLPAADRAVVKPISTSNNEGSLDLLTEGFRVPAEKSKGSGRPHNADAHTVGGGDPKRSSFQHFQSKTVGSDSSLDRDTARDLGDATTIEDHRTKTKSISRELVSGPTGGRDPEADPAFGKSTARSESFRYTEGNAPESQFSVRIGGSNAKEVFGNQTSRLDTTSTESAQNKSSSTRAEVRLELPLGKISTASETGRSMSVPRKDGSTFPREPSTSPQNQTFSHSDRLRLADRSRFETADALASKQHNEASSLGLRPNRTEPSIISLDVEPQQKVSKLTPITNPDGLARFSEIGTQGDLDFEPRPIVERTDLVRETSVRTVLVGDPGDKISFSTAAKSIPPHGIRSIAGEIISHTPGDIEIALSPKELGNLSLRMVAQDGGIIVHVTAERLETADLLRRHSGLLSDELLDHGFETVDFSFAEDRDRHSAVHIEPSRSDSSDDPQDFKESKPFVSQRALDMRF